MKINKAELKQIILEELEETLSDKEKRERERKQTSDKRKTSMMGGEDIVRLTRGITEEPSGEDQQDSINPSSQETNKQLNDERLKILYQYEKLQLGYKKLLQAHNQSQALVKQLTNQLKAAVDEIGTLRQRKQLDIDRCLGFVSNVQDAVKGKKTRDKK